MTDPTIQQCHENESEIPPEILNPPSDMDIEESPNGNPQVEVNTCT